jgi:predicted RNA-binding protein with RPS1 domain
MMLLPFFEYLKSDGLDYGLSADLLEWIRAQSISGLGFDALISHKKLVSRALAVSHLLKIRRAVLRYQALEDESSQVDFHGLVRSWLDLQAIRWANRHAGDPEQLSSLVFAFSAMASATLKRGRLRLLSKDEQKISSEVGDLHNRTEGCLDFPPHRFYKASRAVAEGLLWIDVQVPVSDVDRWTADALDPVLREDLLRAISKPVLDSIAQRAERQVVARAASALQAMLSRAPIKARVAGLAVDKKSLFVAIASDDKREERARFSENDVDGLIAFLRKHQIEVIGLARLDQRSTSSENLERHLIQSGMQVETVLRNALMKQAGMRPGSVKSNAALVVAQRLRDPLRGYADLLPDELGLGEYLDRVDEHRLKAALIDAKAAAAWQVRNGQAQDVLLRGQSLNPMIKNATDLHPGLVLNGTVVNLTHFGAFVDVGLSGQGLVHLSQLADRFVEHPSQVVQVGQQVRVKVINVEEKSRRISLSMRLGEQRRVEKSSTSRANAMRSLEEFFKP